MRRMLLLTTLALAACSESEPTETFARNRECRIAPTTDTRKDTRTGACIVYSRVGSQSICTIWSHYTVQQHRQILTCNRDEWVDQ